MNKMLKILLAVLVLILVLVIGAGAYLSRNLPAIVKEVVEKQGSRVTGTPVSLGGVWILYGTGRVVLKNLRIGNPSGFTTSHAFHLQDLVFQMHLPSVLEEVLVINELAIEGANITAEQAGTSLRTNLQVISDHAKHAAPPAKKSTAAADPASKPVKLIIKQFRFVNNSVDLVSEQWGDRQIVIPDLVLKDLGKNEKGLTPEAMSQLIIKRVTQQANDAVKEELKHLAKEKARESIGGKLKEKFGSWFQ